MDVLITGAAGFLGCELRRRLIAGAWVKDAHNLAFQPSRIVLADRVGVGITNGAPRSDTAPHGEPAIEHRIGSLTDPAFVTSLVGPQTACVFHLAGLVSGTAETDFDGGMQANVDGTRHLLDAIRTDRSGAGRIRIVHASSIAVYGAPLPARIDDTTEAIPTLSYGMQKRICELLIGDLSRRGLIDGRCLRLSGIVVRPTNPNGALSAFNSDLIRETLAGRPVISPVSPQATIWIQSVAHAIDNLLLAAQLDESAFGWPRELLLPALPVTIDQIVGAVAEVAGPTARGLISYRPDAAVEAMFGAWPRTFDAKRARALDFSGDTDLMPIVRDHARTTIEMPPGPTDATRESC